MGTARQHTVPDPAPPQAAAHEPAIGRRHDRVAPESLADFLAGSPRLEAQQSALAAIARGPRAALQQERALRLGAAPAGMVSDAVVQRWPVPSIANLVLLGGGLTAAVSAPAWTSLLAVGGGLAMVVAVVREGAQAFGQTQEPRDEDLDTPTETLDERSRQSEARLTQASQLLSATQEPAQREQGEKLATESMLELAEVEVVKATKKKKKKKKKGKEEKEEEEKEKEETAVFDEQEVESDSPERSKAKDDWLPAKSKKKARGPGKTPLQQVQDGFEQALCRTADRDRPAMGRNNGGEVQGFSGIAPRSAEWQWLKNNVEGEIYADHGMDLRPTQSLRWYVTSRSLSGASFDVSLHLYNGDTDSGTTCLVLHVPK